MLYASIIVASIDIRRASAEASESGVPPPSRTTPRAASRNSARRRRRHGSSEFPRHVLDPQGARGRRGGHMCVDMRGCVLVCERSIFFFSVQCREKNVFAQVHGGGERANAGLRRGWSMGIPKKEGLHLQCAPLARGFMGTLSRPASFISMPRSCFHAAGYSEAHCG